MKICKKLRIKTTALFLMLLCSLSACTDKNGDNNPSNESSVNSQTETISIITTDIVTENSTSSSENINITSESTDSEITDTTITVSEDNFDTTVSDVFSEENTSNEPIATKVSETTKQQITTSKIETTTAITATTTIKPTAQIVIPTIYSVSSPGTNTIKGDNGSIDYSNSSKGYFSAVYTGKATVVKLRVECSGGDKYDHDISPDGKSHYYPLHNGSGKYTIGLYEQIGSSFIQVCSGEFEASVKSDVDMYLYPNNYADFNQNSNIVQKVAEITAGMNSDIDRISAIFKFVTSHVTYDKQFAADVINGTIKKHTPNPDATLKSKKGICYDYASLFAAMSRAQGIPARIVIGYASPDIYHAWNEVYTDETGWITVEYFLGKKGFNRVDATFYSSATDKENVSEYIAKNSNYSSIYIY